MLIALIIALALILVGTLLGVLIYINFLDPDHCIVLLVVLVVWYIASVVISLSLTRYNPDKDEKYVVKTVSNEVVACREDDKIVYKEKDQIKNVKPEYTILTDKPTHLEIVTVKRWFIKSEHAVLYVNEDVFGDGLIKLMIDTLLNESGENVDPSTADMIFEEYKKRGK